MAYIVPTTADFKARFPIFSARPDASIQFMLDEAANFVDNTWEETDYRPAILYLAAHLLATDNSEEGADVDIGVGAGVIASESFAGFSVSYATGGSASESYGVYGSTEYGRRFYRILKNNKTGPVVV